MINRILIRIKVVQMLYSYLLTRSEFKIETMPDDISRDKKYAYSLYFDLLILILKLSGYNIGNNTILKSLNFSALSNAKFAKSLSKNNEIRSILLKENNSHSSFDTIAQHLYDSILSSSAYKDLNKKKNQEIQDEIKFWGVIIRSIISKDEKFIQLARQNSDYTIKGFELAIEMVSNTLSSYNEIKTSLYDARKALTNSLDKSYELYFSIFKLIIELTQIQYNRLDIAKTKYLPTDDDLNPNMRFVDNQLVKSLENNEELVEYLSKHPITWNDDPMIMKNMLDQILASDIYVNYMSNVDNDYEQDCKFWRSILKDIIFNNEEFLEQLEAKSVFWNDDLHIIGTFVLKTIKNFSNNKGEDVSFLSQYKNSEDAEFGAQLFAETINNFNIYQSYIEQFISEQWDSERLAFMDIIIMSTAIAELIKFPLIPVPVTLNEYIEIANSYSTAKSGQFINGILFSVINYLKTEGILNK